MTRAGRQHDLLATLTRHFFTSFFRLSFLDDAGEESFKRAIIWMLAAAAAIGFFLARLFASKCAAPLEPAEASLLVAADRLLIVTLPTVASTLVIALVAHSVFPDDIDYRTLMALPLSRSTVFAAKCAALFGFAAIAVAGANLGLGLPLSLIVNAHSVGDSALAANAAQIAAGVWSSAFAVAASVAVQGLAATLLPRRWLRRASVAIQTATIAGLVLALPFVLRLPESGEAIGNGRHWLYAFPPAWFLGAEQWLLGSRQPHFTRLAIVAVAASVLVATLCALTSAVIYRRFDQSTLRLPAGASPRRRLSPGSLVRWPPARLAVAEFISLTLRRSGLHQLVFATLCAAGAALAANAVMGALDQSPRWAARAALGVPYTMMAGAVVGLRAALLLPTNLRAGWIFRLTERADNRREALDAVRWRLFSVGVVTPVALAAPLQAVLLDIRTAAAVAPISLLVGWVFTEATCLDWRRVPFTCTFLFAKRPPAFGLFAVLMIFGWFVFIATSLADAARSGPIAWLMAAALVVATGSAARWYRLQNWGRWPLEFEDYLPDSIQTLRLGD